VREQLGHLRAVLPVLLELEHRVGDGEVRLAGGHAGEALAHADRRGEVGAAEFVEGRLRVVQLELRWRAGLAKVDDALGLGREVGVAEDAGDGGG
jgi:hypothetical protein